VPVRKSDAAIAAIAACDDGDAPAQIESLHVAFLHELMRNYAVKRSAFDLDQAPEMARLAL